MGITGTSVDQAKDLPVLHPFLEVFFVAMA
jgi:hypothetical protein